MQIHLSLLWHSQKSWLTAHQSVEERECLFVQRQHIVVCHPVKQRYFTLRRQVRRDAPLVLIDINMSDGRLCVKTLGETACVPVLQNYVGRMYRILHGQRTRTCATRFLSFARNGCVVCWNFHAGPDSMMCGGVSAVVAASVATTTAMKSATEAATNHVL
mmetsp:Transcript_119054/g.237398  ORF Transcript_119054/g.237398 Transcript_119054/m.237398 type:complete len:160 (-) Transcript_119054:183-662(-)